MSDPQLAGIPFLSGLVRATDLSRNGMLSYVRALRDAGLISDTEPTPNAAAGVPEFRERYARAREVSADRADFLRSTRARDCDGN